MKEKNWKLSRLLIKTKLFRDKLLSTINKFRRLLRNLNRKKVKFINLKEKDQEQKAKSKKAGQETTIKIKKK